MAVKMVDMKMAKNSSDKLSVCCGYEDYPYGLQISFNKVSIKKLGLEAEDLTTGTQVDFQITVQVTATRQDAGEKSITSCDMQIIKMGEVETADDKD